MSEIEGLYGSEAPKYAGIGIRFLRDTDGGILLNLVSDMIYDTRSTARIASCGRMRRGGWDLDLHNRRTGVGHTCETRWGLAVLSLFMTSTTCRR